LTLDGSEDPCATGARDEDSTIRAHVLRHHVVLEYEAIDRMYLPAERAQPPAPGWAGDPVPSPHIPSAIDTSAHSPLRANDPWRRATACRNPHHIFRRRTTMGRRGERRRQIADACAAALVKC
jgi:hypothetical protein